MDVDVLVTLLSVAVILQSVVIVALLVIMTLVLVKVHRIAKNMDAIMGNLAHATEWLTPTKVIAQVAKLFRK